MANKILVLQGTAIVWADIVGDYNNTPETGTHALVLGGLGFGAARQGAKADMSGGADKFARRYTVTVRVEFETDPAAGETVDVYWAASLSAVAGTANPGLTTGLDAAYAGSVGSTLAETLLQLQFLGSLIATIDDDPVVQQQSFVVEIPTQWGMPVVVNSSAADDLHATDDNMSITFTPLEDEIQ